MLTDEISCPTCYRHEDGTVTVEGAGRFIRVARELLDNALPWVFPDGHRDLIQLDTAGEYRYRFAYAESADTIIYERVQ